MKAKVSTVTFDPLHGKDQEIAAEPTGVYRYNLEHVGYLRASVDSFHYWTFSVGRDTTGFRITQWAVNSDTAAYAVWNRPPILRHWLDYFYSDDSQLAYRSFKSSEDIWSYTRDLLVMALEDEQGGEARWKDLHLWNPQAKIQAVRGNLIMLLKGYRGPSTIPALRWVVSTDPLFANQLLAMSVLESVHSPESDALVIEILSNGHWSSDVIEQALSIAQERGLKVSEPTLVPYLKDYRPSVVKYARALNELLGYPVTGPADPSALFQLPLLNGLLSSLDKLLVDPFGSQTRLVKLAWDFTDSPGSRNAASEQGWLLTESSVSKTLLTTDGLFRSITATDVTTTDMSLTEAAKRFMDLPASVPQPQAYPSSEGGPSFSRGSNQTHAALLGYMLYKNHQNSLAAQVLTRALEVSQGDLLGDVQSSLGQYHGSLMFKFFGGDRDYAAALKEAQIVMSTYPKSSFAAYATELVRQLPLRKEDFKGFRLPTAAEWKSLESGISHAYPDPDPRRIRADKIKYLCERLRLLSVDPYGSQYAEPPGIDAFLWHGDVSGKTRVLNPVVILRTRGTDPISGANGLGMTTSDIPTLAPYLLERWYIPTEIGPRGGGSNDQTHIDPDESLTETRDIVAAVIRGLDPSALPYETPLKELDSAELRARVATLENWTKSDSTRAKALERVKNAKDVGDVIPVLDYLTKNRVKEALPKLLTFLGPDSPYPQHRPWLIAACRTIDSTGCYPEVRKYLVDMDYLVRFHAGLITYEAGDRMDGLMAISFGLKNDGGCALMSGAPVEPALSALLSSKGGDEREVARMALASHCFPTASPDRQWSVINLFSQAHDPSGLQLFLRELADTSTVLTPLKDHSPVPRRDLVAQFILENAVPPNQRREFSFEDPANKRAANVASAKKWVSSQIAEMKRAEKN
jgi:hypothetical protein